MKLNLASGNRHKAAELAAFAAAAPPDGGPPIEIVSACEVGGMPAVKEDTGTFVGNARKKARALQASLAPGAWVLADDSGVCVDALAGGPGVDSAYYAGPQADGRANYEKLLSVLANVPDEQRGAHFLCVLLVLTAAGEEQVFEGICRGRLSRQPRGSAGFGYDPIFVPDGFDRSYAELGEEVKNRISHRAQAWARLAEWMHRITKA